VASSSEEVWPMWEPPTPRTETVSPVFPKARYSISPLRVSAGRGRVSVSAPNAASAKAVVSAVSTKERRFHLPSEFCSMLVGQQGGCQCGFWHVRRREANSRTGPASPVGLRRARAQPQRRTEDRAIVCALQDAPQLVSAEGLLDQVVC